MEITNWHIASIKSSSGSLNVLPLFFLKGFLEKNFDQYGKLKKGGEQPVLIYKDQQGIHQYIPIVRIVRGYVQSDDGKIYKLPGLAKYASKFQFFNGKLVTSDATPYEHQQIQYFSATGKGHVVNEDCYLGVMHPNSPNVKLLLVADGMGGHDAGDKASKFLARQILGWFIDQDVNDLENSKWVYETLPDIIRKTSWEMFVEFAVRRKLDSGSTLAMAIVNTNHTIMANVGDSRIGIVQNGKLNIVSIDDSPLIGTAKPPTPAEQDLMRTMPGHNYITQYVGDKTVNPHMRAIKNTDYTDLFLFSDGITDCMNYSTLNHIACNIDKETLFRFITEASYGEDTEGAKGKATDDETVVHYSRR